MNEKKHTFSSMKLYTKIVKYFNYTYLLGAPTILMIINYPWILNIYCLFLRSQNSYVAYMCAYIIVLCRDSPVFDGLYTLQICALKAQGTDLNFKYDLHIYTVCLYAAKTYLLNTNYVMRLSQAIYSEEE